MIQGGRRDRSRSPVFERGRGNGAVNIMDNKGVNGEMMNTMANMNPLMLNNMYQQGNMMMQGIYSNMMMPGAMISGGMMPSTNMDMMTTTGMEMIPQQSMDMTAMGAQTLAPAAATAMDMNMMGGMMMDPSMMGMGIYGNMGTDVPIPVVEKKEITLKHCILTPPDPGTPDPPRRKKPPGCRTIFVGGLPDKIKEDIVRDIFGKYGRIHTLRLSKKNFCHIRFDREACVDAAMQLSGYRITIVDKENKEEDEGHDASGWMHVDYALSRDDQNEYERRQRQVMRAQAQMEQMNTHNDFAATASVSSGRHSQSRQRSPSPIRVQPFSIASVKQLVEKIKSEDHFASILPTLLMWLERGECTKKTFIHFYSLLQVTNGHVRRLYNEKMQAEEELQQCKENVKLRIERVIEQLEQVGKVFNAATHQRNWDHFTKPQRKNIETWQKMAQEFSNIKEEFNEKLQAEDTDNMNYGYNNMSSNLNEDSSELKRENESLQFQLEAYKNEVDVIKADAKRELEKFKAQFIARQALQGKLDIKNNPSLPSPTQKPAPPLLSVAADLPAMENAVEAGCGEAKLIGVMSAFLQVHPQGASLDYVVSYVQALFSQVPQATVHHVLQKHTDVFQQTTSGVGANIENRWKFIAFQKENSIA